MDSSAMDGSYEYIADSNIQALLVVENMKENPFYVPFVKMPSKIHKSFDIDKFREEYDKTTFHSELPKS
jgi:hypothetical protein